MASDSKAAEALPLDIIFKILSGLPIKTLCTFRVVSKSWSALISDPIFQQSQDELSSKKPVLVVSEIGHTIHGHPKLNYSLFDKESRTLNFVTSLSLSESMDPPMPASACSDLLCAYGNQNIYICNLAMKKWITLSDTSSHYMSMLPDKHLRQLAALGYVASTSEYKVLRAYTRSSRYNYDGDDLHDMVHHSKCEVFTLGSKSWRAVESPPNDVVIDYKGSVAIGDGALYFISYHDIYEIGAVAVFDLSKEEWSAFPIPDNVRILGQGVDASSFSLMHAGGLLRLAHITVDESVRYGYWNLKKDLILWILKDHDNWVWEKECSIENCYSHPLAIEQDGRVLMRRSKGRLQYFDSTDNELTYYDPRDGSSGHICAGKSDFTASFYAESFRSLNIRGFKHAPAPILQKKDWTVILKKNRRRDPAQANSNVHSIATKNQFMALDEDEDDDE